MRVKREGDKLYLFPETDLVASRIEKLRDFFKKQLNEHSDIDHIYLNVQDVDIVDSLGVNLIVGLYQELTEKSKTMEIIGAGENFMKVANFFRLTSLFPVTEGIK